MFESAPPPARTSGTLIAGIVVGLLLLGAGTVYGVSRLAGGSDEPGGTTGAGSPAGSAGFAVAWKADYAGTGNLKDLTTERLHASYLVGDVVVRVQSDGVAGYRVTDGSQAWGTPIPQGTTMCSASRGQDGGYAAIAYGTASACSTVSAIDLTTGRIAFKTQVKTRPVSGRGRAEAPLLGITSGHVVAASGGEVTSYRATDGARRWSATGSGKGLSKCAIGLKFAVDNGLAVTTETCLGKAGRLVALDPATGKRKWAYEMPAGSLPGDLVSAVPTVVTQVFSRGGYAFTVIDASTGKLMSEVFEDVYGQKVDTMSLGVEIGQHLGLSRSPVRVSGTTMYVPLMGAGSGDRPQIAAINLTSGVAGWTSTGHQAKFIPIAADETGLLGFEDGGFQVPARLVRLAAADGARTEVRKATQEGLMSLPYNADIHQAGETLLFLPINQVLKSDKTAIYAVR